MVFSAVCLKHSHDIPECRAPLMAKDTDKALVRYYKERGGGGGSYFPYRHLWEGMGRWTP